MKAWKTSTLTTSPSKGLPSRLASTVWQEHKSVKIYQKALLQLILVLCDQPALLNKDL